MEAGKEEKKSPDVKFRISQIERAKERSKPYWALVNESWDEYLGPDAKRKGADSELKSSSGTRYPWFWSSVNTRQPALYSQTPIPQAEKAFTEEDDKIAKLAAIAHEDLAEYMMKSCDFDDTQYSTRDNFLIAARGTNRVVLESSFKDKVVKEYYAPQQIPPQPGQPPSPQPQYQWVNNVGEVLQTPEQLAQLQQDDQGYYINKTLEELERACIDLVSVHTEDILHNPDARKWREMKWVAFRNRMTRQDVRKRFDKEAKTFSDKLVYLDDAKDENREAKERSEGTTSIWEMWCLDTKSVYWIDENYKEDFLDSKPDPYKLARFFPCSPFIVGTCGPDSLYPVPDFIQMKSLINQMHAMADRFRRLLKASKVVGLADGSVPELQAIEDAGDAVILIVQKFQELIVGKGGLENLVQFFPTDKLMAAATNLANAINLYETKCNEFYGTPDILRGSSDPTETAAAQQLKGQYTSLRFSFYQKEFQRLVRDDIEMMCDLALKIFPADKLREIMGVRFWKAEDQALWPQVLTLLKDDQDRKIRINIETDSTITMNQNFEAEKRNYLAKTVFEGLSAVAKASGENEAFMVPTLQVLMLVVQGLKKGKEVEDSLRQMIAKLTAPKPQGPPPRDYEGEKIDLDKQELAYKQQALAIEQQQKGDKTAIEAEKARLQAENDSLKHELKAVELANQQEIALKDHELEQTKVILSEREKMLTELRLQREEAREERSQQLQISVTSDGEKKKKKGRKIKIHRDALGELDMLEELDGDSEPNAVAEASI